MMSLRRTSLLLAALAASPAAAPAQQVILTPPSRVVELSTGAAPVQQVPVVQNQVIGSPTTTTPAASTIGSHQIDRFEAIRQLQADLKSDPNNIANWTILGELAHEVALDIPQGQDDAYYTLSREAYERAAALDPNNPGLKSAVQFAREQETGSAAFDAQRRQGVATYLDARRREMAMTGINPTVMVYETPTTTVTTPATATQPVPTTPYATAPRATYRPYYNAQAQQPYSYNQYSTGYAPPTGVGVGAAGNAAPPVTLRQYGQQLPGVLINQGVRSLTTPAAPR